MWSAADLGISEYWSIGINAFYTISIIMIAKSGTLKKRLTSIRPETVFLLVILRSPADGGMTKNLEILRGACPAHSSKKLTEGLRMVLVRFRADTNSFQQCWTFLVELVSSL